MTSYIAKTWSKIAIENLCVSGMLANRKLSKAVGDQAFFEFRHYQPIVLQQSKS